MRKKATKQCSFAMGLLLKTTRLMLSCCVVRWGPRSEWDETMQGKVKMLRVRDLFPW